MHSVLTADLAALISQHGPAILYSRESVPPEAVTEYWTSCRNRFELWHQTMARYRRAEHSGDFAALRNWWRDHVVVLEEVLVTELLTRVVAALACNIEEDVEHGELSPVTHAAYLNHLEARNRVQQIMLFGRGISVRNAVNLNRLRQGVERWTDALIGRMCSGDAKSLKYAIDRQRAAQFAEEIKTLGQCHTRNTTIWLMNASMHDTLRRRTTETTALPEANRGVAKSVMLMLRPDLFDSVGVLKSLWLHRLQVTTDRTDRVLNELNGKDINQASTAEGLQDANENYFERWYL